jgi:hypothetical protein
MNEMRAAGERWAEETAKPAKRKDGKVAGQKSGRELLRERVTWTKA